MKQTAAITNQIQTKKQLYMSLAVSRTKYQQWFLTNQGLSTSNECRTEINQIVLEILTSHKDHEDTTKNYKIIL